MKQQAFCQCGECKINIMAEPITRFICHCKICQEFNQADYADVSLYRTQHVVVENPGLIDFNKYKRPPALARGKCRSCKRPIVEYLNLPLWPSLTLIPTACIQPQAEVRSPRLHIFYHRRQQAVDDGLPKHSGFFKSQAAMFWEVMGSLLKSP